MPINRLSAFCVVAVAALLCGPAVQAHTGKSHAKPAHAKHVNHHRHSQAKLAHHKKSQGKTAHAKTAHANLAHSGHHRDVPESATASAVVSPVQHSTAGFDFTTAPLAGAATSGLPVSGNSMVSSSVQTPAWLNSEYMSVPHGTSFAATPAMATPAFAVILPASAVAVASVVVPDASVEPSADAGNASVTDLRKSLIAMAMNLRDIRYVRGGHDPSTGFDCSGFVRYVFAHAIGMQLPTNSASQFLAGLKVKRADMKPGDLVFFHTRGKRISHVGIYISEGRFIHSPASGKSVEISSLDEAYWAKRFAGAKRPEGMAMVANKG